VCDGHKSEQMTEQLSQSVLTDSLVSSAPSGVARI